MPSLYTSSEQPIPINDDGEVSDNDIEMSEPHQVEEDRQLALGMLFLWFFGYLAGAASVILETRMFLKHALFELISVGWSRAVSVSTSLLCGWIR